MCERSVGECERMCERSVGECERMCEVSSRLTRASGRTSGPAHSFRFVPGEYLYNSTNTYDSSYVSYSCPYVSVQLYANVRVHCGVLYCLLYST